MSIFEEKTHLAYPLRKKEKIGPISYKGPSSPYRRQRKKTYFSAEQMIRSLKDYRLARL